MTRTWTLLACLVAAVVAVAVFLLSEGGPGELGEALDAAEGEGYVPPELRGLPPSERAAWLRRQREAARRAEAEAEPPPETPTEDTARVVAEGRVVAAEDGTPLAGVLVWLEGHREPCPRLPAETDAPTLRVMRLAALAGEPLRAGVAVTDAEGAFRLRARADELPAGPLDLFAHKQGRVLHATCALSVPASVELRLPRGLVLAGVLSDPQGRPVAGARVHARPGPETPAEPGHGTTALDAPETDEKGRFALPGLLPGEVLVHVEHPRFMPGTFGPYEPADESAVALVLVPALWATFDVRTDDGAVPEHPTLLWRAAEGAPRSEALLLPRKPPDVSRREPGVLLEAEGVTSWGPVRLPCDVRPMVLLVKADGYAAWQSAPVRLPPEGGEETFQVDLVGDLGTGSARIVLEDESGESVSVAGSEARVKIGRLDPGAAQAAYVLEQAEDLHITDLPEGSYRIRILSAAFAPAETDIAVVAGQQTDEILRVRPPARVRVRFFGPEPGLLVRFRLTQEGRVAEGVPVGSYARGTDEASGEPILTAGEEGLLLSGLEAGTYVVEVSSEELEAPPTVVHLKEGETEEVEVRVSFR